MNRIDANTPPSWDNTPQTTFNVPLKDVSWFIADKSLAGMHCIKKVKIDENTVRVHMVFIGVDMHD